MGLDIHSSGVDIVELHHNILVLGQRVVLTISMNTIPRLRGYIGLTGLVLLAFLTGL